KEESTKRRSGRKNARSPMRSLSSQRAKPGAGRRGKMSVSSLWCYRDGSYSNRLMVFPIILGSGKRVFREGSEQKTLKLVETKTFVSGVVVLSYEPAAKGDEQ